MKKEFDKNGNVKIGPKRLPEDLYDYLVSESKKRRAYQNVIIIEALELHREKSQKVDS